MRYRITLIAVLTGLLVTGCSSGGGSETELAEYELCLENRRIEVASKDKFSLEWKGLTSEGGLFYNDEKGRALTDTELVLLLCKDYRP